MENILLCTYSDYLYHTFFLNVYMYICNHLGTGRRLGVHKTFKRRSVTTCGRLLCF